MQTSYSINQAAGLPGQIADSSLVKDIESYKNPAGAVKFGYCVTRGTNVGECRHPVLPAEVTDEKLVKGIVVASHEIESVNDGEVPGYAAESVVPVMRKGRIWVISATAVTEGTSLVYVRVAANGGNTLVGGLTTTSDTSFTAVLPKSKWKSSTSGAAELAVLEIDL